MYCRNCGAFIPEGNAFCEQCGTPVPKRTPAYENRTPDYENRGPDFAPETPAFENPPAASNKRRVAIIAIIAAATVCVGCICGVLLWGDGPSYTKKLETARQYVEEENYDQAEDAYLDLIADQPKKEKAYLELSDVYMTQKRYEDSVAILKKGEEATGKEDKFKEPIRRAQKSYSGVWKKAYQKILQDNQLSIEIYEYPQYGDSRGATALCDINDDGTPELFFMSSMYDYGGGLLYVYSYRKGKAVELDVEFPQMNLSRSTEMEAHFIDAAAGAGTKYVIYDSEQEDRFVICATNADEDSQLISCEYTIDEDLNVSPEYWGHVTNLVFSDNGGELLREDHEYYHVDDTIDQKEFDQRQKQLEEDMKEILLTNCDAGFDEPILRKAGGSDSSARYCADMIRDLEVKETDDEDNGGKAAASTDYSTVLDEYESVLKQIMDGSYIAGDDISSLGDLKYVPESFVIGVSDPGTKDYRTNLTLQYAEADLNGDGTKELIVGCLYDEVDRPAIDSIYTMNKKGSPVRLISCDSFMYRATLDVMADGIISYSGSSGATANSYDYYSLPKSGSELKTEESFATRSDEDDYDTIIYEHNGETLSEEEFNSLLEKRVSGKMMKLDWKEK
ncbi:MAG: hypothetical protein IJ128_04150 [Firmicutes bacterium]|nr:hypothetical protein [Bacillota bacterium]